MDSYQPAHYVPPPFKIPSLVPRGGSGNETTKFLDLPLPHMQLYDITTQMRILWQATLEVLKFTKAQTSLKSYLKLATEFSNRNVAHINMA